MYKCLLGSEITLVYKCLLGSEITIVYKCLLGSEITIVYKCLLGIEITLVYKCLLGSEIILVYKFNVSLNVHHELTIQNTNVMHLILFIRQIFSSTCFEYQVLILRRIQLYVSSICYRHSL